MLQFTAPIIRQEIPDAVIVASQYPWPGHDAADLDGDGQPERYMERVAERGGYQDIDVIEIHDFTSDLAHLVEGLTYAHQTSGKPVWAGQVLATNAPAGGQPDANPTTQAQKVVKLLVGALASGAQHAHWWGLQNAPQSAVESGGIVPVFAYAGLYAPCPSAGQSIGQICTDAPLYPAGVNFRLLSDAFVGYQSLTNLEPLALGVLPGQADSSRLVVRVDREGSDPSVIAWDDAGGMLNVDGLFPSVSRVQVLHFVTQEGVAQPQVEGGVSGTISLSATPVLITPDPPTATGDPALAKIEPDLLRIIELEELQPGLGRERAPTDFVFDSQERVSISVFFDRARLAIHPLEAKEGTRSQMAVQLLIAHGVVVEHEMPSFNKVSGWAPLGSLRSLACQEAVVYIEPLRSLPHSPRPNLTPIIITPISTATP